MLAIGNGRRKRIEILEKVEELVPEIGKLRTTTNIVDTAILKNETFRNLIKKETRGIYYLELEAKKAYTHN